MENENWNDREEKGNVAGILILALIYRYTGIKGTALILMPVVLFYATFNHAGRRASYRYLKTLGKHFNHLNIKSNFYYVMKHFYTFAIINLEQITNYNEVENSIKHNEETHSNLLILRKAKKGAVLLLSHQGNPHLLRRVTEHSNTNRKIHFLTLQTTPKAQKVIDLFALSSNSSSIAVEKLDIPAAITLKNDIDNNHWIGTMADRVFNDSKKFVIVDFLGKKAKMPQGPWILSALMECPIYAIWMLKDNQKYEILIKKITDRLILPPKSKTTKDREKFIQQKAQDYADEMSKICEKYPLQWFNFFNFWEE